MKKLPTTYTIRQIPPETYKKLIDTGAKNKIAGRPANSINKVILEAIEVYLKNKR